MVSSDFDWSNVIVWDTITAETEYLTENDNWTEEEEENNYTVMFITDKVSIRYRVDDIDDDDEETEEEEENN